MSRSLLCRALAPLVPALAVVLVAAAVPASGGEPAAAPLDAQRRIDSRDFPSVFEAWSPAQNLKAEDPAVTLARHDLVLQGPSSFRLRWNNPHTGLADGFLPASIPAARALRAKLLKLNPRLVFIAEIRYRDAPGNYLPADSPWWKRKDGIPEAGWAEGEYLKLDFANAGFQKQVAAQAQAAMASGVFDGVFFDWWKEDDDRVALIKVVRAAVGESALILVNTNDLPAPRTAGFINGLYMECYRTKTAKDWRRIADTLQWAEKSLREPRINCVETWFHNSRQDLDLMRATTTLSLTMSDGYCLFCDPDPLPTPDHLHDWYDFWNKSLGKPVALGEARADGGWQREFQSGSAVYNPLGNPPIVVRFDTPRVRSSTGASGMQFTVSGCDGDIFLRPSQFP